MRKVLVLLFVVLSMVTFGQISTIEVSDGNVPLVKYDSLINFIGDDVYMYIGQEFYLIPKAESLREYGYDGFYDKKVITSSNKKNVYECIKGGYNTEYNMINGKYFNVVGVHKHPKINESAYKYGKIYYIELKEKESGDIVFFEYKSQYKSSFPFLVVGYFNKQKELYVNTKIVVRGKNWISNDKPMTDVKTGNLVSFEKGSIWVVKDLSLDKKYYTLCMILQNDKNENITLGLNTYNSSKNRAHWGIYELKTANFIKEVYGASIWETILDGNIKIGFTEEMVKLAWGEPKKINRSSYGDQWVYDSQYLYFEKGKLKSYN